MSRSRGVKLLFLCLAIVTPFLIRTSSKNVCTSYFDYFLINFGGDCYFNPDVELTVPQLIKKYTGNVHVYNITTPDGYVLSMFRIFRKNPVGVILLQPPSSAGSIAYMSDGSHSLGFALWHNGYDVWLSNHRGASYSREHINLTESDPDFWNFSFHEIALNDLKPQFEVISRETNSKIIFIGYSMAATEALIYASLKPNDAEKYIQSFVLIAPLTVLQNFSSPFALIIYIMKPFERFFRLGEFPTFESFRWLTDKLTITPSIVNLFASIVMGWTLTEMDPELYPYVFAHHGRGMSNKMVYHYGDIFSNKTHFMNYDYGEDDNKIIYGEIFPPVYPLQNVKQPIYIIHGEKDRISTPQDVTLLCEVLLPKETVAGIFSIQNHNHIDYLFSRHRRTKAYDIIFTILNQIQNVNYVK